MTKGRETTQAERIAVAKACLANGKNYGEAAISYNVSYQQARSLDIKSTIKYKNNGCTRQAANPQHIAKNWLNRQFRASMPNEKWLTDVTESKWYEGPVVHKVYLSASLDLYDRRIVSFIIRDRNDNPLVFDALDAAIKANPDLFHLQQPLCTAQPGRSDTNGKARELSDGGIRKPQKMAGREVLTFPEVPTVPQCRVS